MIPAPRDERLQRVLDFIFSGKRPWGLVRNLALPPMVLSHRNQIPENAFLLPMDRFGGREDVPLIPLMRRVVDESLEAFSSFFPRVRELVGRSPISPHGSMANSIRYWGAADWDYARDIDWKIYLPPQIGHESGFLSFLQDRLARELRSFDLKPLFKGKDFDGRPQVQLRDIKSGVVHGFHLYLISMTRGFAAHPLHEGGGYSIHQTYFPEDSINPYLEEAAVTWDGLILRQRQQYEEMFARVSFNTFGGDDPASLRLKTKGWYSKKAFKWYAVLADLRGLDDLTAELLAQYRAFGGAPDELGQGTHEELVHLIRRHYFALLDPKSVERRKVDRELSAALSLAYARSRSPAGDGIVGREAPDPDSRVQVLEPVPRQWLEDAFSFLSSGGLDIPPLLAESLDLLKNLAESDRIRFADGVEESGIHPLPDGERGMLLPSVWSFMYLDGYARRVALAAAEADHPFSTADFHNALIALLAGQLASIWVVG